MLLLGCYGFIAVVGLGINGVSWWANGVVILLFWPCGLCWRRWLEWLKA